jgi:integrase
MPFHEWPLQDQARWKAAVIPQPFDLNPKPLAAWSVATHRHATSNYGIWLRFIERTEPDILLLPLERRVTPQRIGRFLGERLPQISAATLAQHALDLYGVMTSLSPGEDWGWLGQVRRLTGTHAKRQPPKQRAFVHASELLCVGEKLLAKAFSDSAELNDPVAFRDGLIILMLILVPVRIAQFSLIRLDQHLVQTRENEWTLYWEEAETKTRRKITYPLRSELVEVLQIYLDQVRPALCQRRKGNAASQALWIGNSGAPIGAKVLRGIIKARTKEELGYKVTPHTFRSSAASSYAIEAPAHAREASALLDHADPRTTERYYLVGQRARHLRTAHAALRAIRKATA